MAKDQLLEILDDLDRSIEAGTEKAAPHLQGVMKASQSLFEDIKAHQKKFREMESKVRGKVDSGIRRTQGDPV